VRILVAEDDAFFRRLLLQLLPDYQVQVAENGDCAWAMMQQPDPPPLAILDWVMPGMSGPHICRKVRDDPRLAATHIILLTARNSIPDIVSGLRAGADDYVTKPFNAEELRARVRVGQRMVELRSTLATQVAALENALTRERWLQHLLPICPVCGAKRTDGDYWRELDNYLNAHSELRQGPAVCHACAGNSSSLNVSLLEPSSELPR